MHDRVHASPWKQSIRRGAKGGVRLLQARLHDTGVHWRRNPCTPFHQRHPGSFGQRRLPYRNPRVVRDTPLLPDRLGSHQALPSHQGSASSLELWPSLSVVLTVFSPRQKGCVVVLYEAVRAKVVLTFTLAAGAAISPSVFGFPLFGPVRVFNVDRLIFPLAHDISAHHILSQLSSDNVRNSWRVWRGFPSFEQGS